MNLLQAIFGSPKKPETKETVPCVRAPSKEELFVKKLTEAKQEVEEWKKSQTERYIFEVTTKTGEKFLSDEFAPHAYVDYSHYRNEINYSEKLTSKDQAKRYIESMFRPGLISVGEYFINYDEIRTVKLIKTKE
jgi:hypothetical protein